VPLFSDQARAQIGTLYKHQGKEAAIKLGLSLVGPRLHELVEQVEKIAHEKVIRVHCWRGGMRSASFAWLLNLSGYTVYLLEGGYKQYRAFMREQFQQKYKIISIAGKTGSGKTDFLKTLAALGYQVIDLEALANHKGSVFGHLGLDNQPTQEAFENRLGMALYELNVSEPVFIEKESRRIGQLLLPDAFFEQLRDTPSIQLETDTPERIKRIMRDYGSAEKHALIFAVKKIEKHLGGALCKTIITHIEENNYSQAIVYLLEYYDKYYGESSQKQSPVLDPSAKDVQIKNCITRLLADNSI
jgi:tRNA 2-selenouridine synthase